MVTKSKIVYPGVCRLAGIFGTAGREAAVPRQKDVKPRTYYRCDCGRVVLERKYAVIQPLCVQCRGLNYPMGIAVLCFMGQNYRT